MLKEPKIDPGILKDLCVELGFGKLEQRQPIYVIITYNIISKELKKSYSWMRNTCEKHLE